MWDRADIFKVHKLICRNERHRVCCFVCVCGLCALHAPNVAVAPRITCVALVAKGNVNRAVRPNNSLHALKHWPQCEGRSARAAVRSVRSVRGQRADGRGPQSAVFEARSARLCFSGCTAYQSTISAGTPALHKAPRRTRGFDTARVTRRCDICVLLLRVLSLRESVFVHFFFLSAFVRAALPVVLCCFVCVGSGSGLGRDWVGSEATRVVLE